jgi:hypothetical protein
LNLKGTYPRRLAIDGTTFVIDEFAEAYIRCALWSSTDDYDQGTTLDEAHGITDIHPDTLAAMLAECRFFLDDNASDIGPRYSQAGQDFWLTRNHHGAGFWDGDWPHDAGQRLTDAAHVWGSVDLYLGDDGRIHQS